MRRVASVADREDERCVLHLDPTDPAMSRRFLFDQWAIGAVECGEGDVETLDLGDAGDATLMATIYRSCQCQLSISVSV